MIQSHHIHLETKQGTGIFEVTREVEKAVSDSMIAEGTCTIFAVGSTCAIATLEFESGLIEDMTQALERLFPQHMTYEHERRWHDGNGHSHIRASFLGQSLVVPITGGRLVLGTWQQVVFIELDNKPRTRAVVVQVMGE